MILLLRSFRRGVDGDFWNDSGCSTIHFENGSVMCSCNHLTHFSVIIPGSDMVHVYNNYYNKKIIMISILYCSHCFRAVSSNIS